MGQPLSFYPFDTRFVGPKPRNEVDPGWLKATEASGALGIFRKYDGYGALVPIASHAVDLYSRTCTRWTGRFPAIEADLAAMRVPPETLLAGEMTVDYRGRNDMDLFGRFARSGIETSIALQRNYNPVQLRLFNVLVYHGRDVSGLPYRDRLALLEDLCARSSGFVSTIKELGVSFETAKRLVRKNKWEGLVLYDMRAGTKFRVDGNSKIPLRPEGCVKWKPIVEDDFVATGWLPSDSASFAGLVRDLLIGQYDPVTKELIDCGRVGTGLSHNEKRRLTDSTLYPLVVQLKFECRTENNKLKKASIMRVRDDKLPEECIHPYSIAA